jgi:gluconolactonase
MQMEIEGLYYINRGGKLSRVADDLKQPNGLTLSPDRKTLYVADLGDRKIIAYDVTGAGQIANKRTFANVSSDGMTIDANGNIYCTYQGSVIAIAPDGKEIGRLKPPEAPANCLLVGNTLYITARTGFYSVKINAVGLQ